MECTSCGQTNRPSEARCIACGRRLQGDAAAAVARERWERTPEQLRQEINEAVVADQRRHAAHIEWLRKRRVKAVALGAILMPLAALLGGIAPAMIPLDVFLGAVAAAALVTCRGGARRGLACFLTGYALHIVVRGGSGSAAYDILAWGLGAVGVGSVGWMLGAWLDGNHMGHTFS